MNSCTCGFFRIWSHSPEDACVNTRGGEHLAARLTFGPVLADDLVTQTKIQLRQWYESTEGPWAAEHPMETRTTCSQGPDGRRDTTTSSADHIVLFTQHNSREISTSLNVETSAPASTHDSHETVVTNGQTHAIEDEEEERPTRDGGLPPCVNSLSQQILEVSMMGDGAGELGPRRGSPLSISSDEGM